MVLSEINDFQTIFDYIMMYKSYTQSHSPDVPIMSPFPYINEMMNFKR